MNRDLVFELIKDELHLTDCTKQPFRSNHEALGVALEEWDEFKDEIRDSHEERKANRLMVNEAVQLAGVMVKFVENLYNPKNITERN